MILRAHLERRRGRCAVVVAALGATLLATLNPPACRTILDTPPPAPAWHRMAIGVAEDYPEETRAIAAARRELLTARQAGARVLRVALGWDGIETARGSYDWNFWDELIPLAVDGYGFRLIPYICYTPEWAAPASAGSDFWRSPPRDPMAFGRFVETAVRRYRRWVHDWEFWNEPDNPAYWLGTIPQYADLVRAGSAAVRRVDPRANVVLGGLAWNLDFLTQLLRDEHLAPAIDVVNLHSYFETWQPEPIGHLPAYVDAAAEIVRRHGEAEPLWMAETGYSSVGPRRHISSVYEARTAAEHTPSFQAHALARTILLALDTTQLEVLGWYRIKDLPPSEMVIGDDNNRHLGLLAADGTPKPALATFRFLAGLFRGRYRVLKPSVQLAPGTRSVVHVLRFALEEGRQVVALWREAADSVSETPPVHGDALLPDTVEKITAVLPGAAGLRIQIVGPAGQPVPAAGSSDREGDVELHLPLHDREVALILIGAETSPDTRLHTAGPSRRPGSLRESGRSGKAGFWHGAPFRPASMRLRRDRGRHAKEH